MSKESMFRLIEWHRGHPPHPGWWMASRNSEPGIWRWWDGAFWSLAANDFDAAELAASLAGYIDLSDDIQWCDFYPGNARVPRVVVKWSPPVFKKYEGSCIPVFTKDDGITAQVLAFIEMAGYCYPTAAKTLLNLIRNSPEPAP